METSLPLSTTTQPEETATVLDFLKVERWKYLFIHISALIALTTSLSLGLTVIIYFSKNFKQFFKQPIGDRIVVYLAFVDLGFSSSLFCDQINMLIRGGSTQDPYCAVIGYFVTVFLLAQAAFVAFAAVNAFSLVVLRKKINTGKWDLRLLLTAYGLPCIMGIVFGIFSMIGPSEAWCFLDKRQESGKTLYLVFSTFVLVAVVCAVGCYSAVWYKIREVAKKQKQSNNKYAKTAKVMMLFVAAYIFQWVPGVTYAMWGVTETPHYIMIWAACVFIFSGGLFNFVSFTFIRKAHSNVESDNSTGNGKRVVVTVQ